MTAPPTCPVADPQWSDMQQAAAPGAGKQQPLYAADEFGPMASASPRIRTSTGELAEVSIDAGGGADSKPGKPGKQPADSLGRRPSFQLTVDSRAQATACVQMGALSIGRPAPVGAGHAGAGASRPAAAAGELPRADSGGLDYAPDSRAVMARINRWWKHFDETHMQPKFGGPASPNASSNNLAAAGATTPARPVHGSSKSFSLPVSRPGG